MFEFPSFWTLRDMKMGPEKAAPPGGGGGGGGEYSQKNRVGMCGPLPKTFTLFMTKTCDIPYPFYDLTKNS